ncbi:MAG: transglutaminase-like domain-containing protein [Myxococcota bacterium]|nr:transglutaminase-like domain-containing protein [Myxococcota bacterium]
MKWFHQSVRALRFPLRMMTMIPVVISLLWDYQQGYAMFASVLAGMLAIPAGEYLGRTKIRAYLFFLALIIGSVVVKLLGESLGYFDLFASVLGTSLTLQLQAMLYGFGFVFLVAAALRALAHRNMIFFALEFWAIALCCAASFAPHRNGKVLQPLWLSDLAWSYGLEPTYILGFIGSGLALMLALLTLLEKTKRIPFSIALLPLLALFMLITVLPSSERLQEQQAQGANELLKDMQSGGDPQIMRGGQSKPEQNKRDRDENGKEQERAQKNDGEGQGQSYPLAVVLMETDFTPPSEYYYMRQEALSAYNGIRLTPTRDRSIPYDGILGFPMVPAEAAEAPPMDEGRQEIQGTVALLTPHTAPFGIESIMSYTPTKNPRPSTFVQTYAFTSSATTFDYEDYLDYAVGNPDWDDKLWEHYTIGPEDERYKQLADDIVSTLPDRWRDNPFAQALAIKLYLDENTRYTRKVRHAEAKDPTASFLFGPQNQFIGYCVHTSHAAVFLWRAIGIPARVGVGYAVEAQNRRADGFMISNVDAHAWPELYMEGVGWVPFDIAPAENLDQGAQSIDEQLRDSLMELAREQEHSEFRRPIDWTLLWKKIKPIILYGLGVVLFLVFGLHYAVKIYRRTRFYWSPLPHFYYVSALDTLSEQGWRRNSGESPEGFARRIDLPAFQVITQAHVANALGRDVVDASGLVKPQTELSSQLSSKVSFGRRILGLLNPFSFYLSR